jgi:hypothetical protein
MQARYGLDRRPVGRWIAVGILIVAFVGILVFVGKGITSNPTATRLIGWNAVAPDRVNITYQASTDPDSDVICVLRAQDSHRIDVGYATVTIPATSAKDLVIATYALHTLAPAYTAELLGCEAGTTPRVPAPQFPPGVVPPSQPYPGTG